MAIADASGLPVAAHVESASPHKVKLIETTIDRGFTKYAPDKIIGDKAYDSDKLDHQLSEERGIEMGCHRFFYKSQFWKPIPAEKVQLLHTDLHKWIIKPLFSTKI
jgi:hypothetical protein